MTPTAVILIVVVGAVTLIAGLLIGYIYRKSVGSVLWNKMCKTANNFWRCKKNKTNFSLVF